MSQAFGGGARFSREYCVQPASKYISSADDVGAIISEFHDWEIVKKQDYFDGGLVVVMRCRRCKAELTNELRV
jgi:hypothetical protein